MFAVRQLAPIASRLTGRQAASPALRRGFASDAHGEVRVNFWEAPTEIAKWKEEQIVLGVLAAWGVTIFGAIKVFGGKKEPEAPKA